LFDLDNLLEPFKFKIRVIGKDSNHQIDYDKSLLGVKFENHGIEKVHDETPRLPEHILVVV
jgi:hypothetical protein